MGTAQLEHLRVQTQAAVLRASAKPTVCTREGENSSSALGVRGTGLRGMQKEPFVLYSEKAPSRQCGGRGCQRSPSPSETLSRGS